MSEYLVASMHHLRFTTSCAKPHLPTTTTPSPPLPLLPAFCAPPIQPISASPILLSTSTAPPDLSKTAVLPASLSLCPMDRSHQRNRAPTYTRACTGKVCSVEACSGEAYTGEAYSGEACSGEACLGAATSTLGSCRVRFISKVSSKP